MKKIEKDPVTRDNQNNDPNDLERMTHSSLVSIYLCSSDPRVESRHRSTSPEASSGPPTSSKRTGPTASAVPVELDDLLDERESR